MKQHWINVRARAECPDCGWVEPKADGSCPICGYNILHLENGPGMEGVTAIDKKKDALKGYIKMIYGDNELDGPAIERIKRSGEETGLTSNQVQEVLDDIKGGR